MTLRGPDRDPDGTGSRPSGGSLVDSIFNAIYFGIQGNSAPDPGAEVRVCR